MKRLCSILLTLLALHNLSAREIDTLSIDRVVVTRRVNPAALFSDRRMVESVPSILGENDAVKYATTLSGVVSTSILDPNFYVRGGGGDENLFLVDGFPVASPQHLSGVLSLFDPYVLPNSTLYKSGYPLSYGGAASSYLDMRPLLLRDSTICGEVSLGLIASSARLTIPTSDDGGVRVSVRGSYLEPIMRLVNRINPDVDVVEYQFYDVTTSFEEGLGDRWRMKLFGLYSTDAIDVEALGDIKFGWHSYSLNGGVERRYDNSTLSIDLGGWGRNRTGEYSYLVDEPIIFGEYTLKLQSCYEQRFDLFSTDLSFGASVESTQYRGDVERGCERDYIGKGWFSLRSITSSGVVVELGTALNYYRGAVTALNLLPRLRCSYQLGGGSLYADYSRVAQYSSTVMVLSLPTPADVVMPLREGERSTLVDQISVGGEWCVASPLSLYGALFWRNYINAKETSGVSLTNSLLSLSSADLRLGGRGGAKGVEVELKLSGSNYSLRANYTLCDSWRQFDQLNDGERYSPPFDITHNFTTTAEYRVTNRLSLSALWQYSSGRYLTFPIGVALSNNVMHSRPTLIPVYDDLYNYRLPATHRLDIGVEYAFERWRVSGGVYNAYNQPNISFLSFSVEEFNDYQAYIQPKGTSLLPMIPYLSATFEF